MALGLKKKLNASIIRGEIVKTSRWETQVLFSFRIFALIESAALLPIVLRYACDRADSHTQSANNCPCPLLSFFFFRVLCTVAVFSLYGE